MSNHCDAGGQPLAPAGLERPSPPPVPRLADSVALPVGGREQPGLAAIAAGIVCFAAAATRELSDPFFGRLPGLPFALVPLAAVVVGSFNLGQSWLASSGAAGGRLLARLRLASLGWFLLTPFVWWNAHASRSIYLAAAAAAVVCGALYLWLLAEFLKHLFLARRQHRLAVRAHRVRQLVHYLFLVPAIATSIILLESEIRHGLKAAISLNIAWTNATAHVKFAVLSALALPTGGLLRLLWLAATGQPPPPPPSPSPASPAAANPKEPPPCP